MAFQQISESFRCTPRGCLLSLCMSWAKPYRPPPGGRYEDVCDYRAGMTPTALGGILVVVCILSCRVRAQYLACTDPASHCDRSAAVLTGAAEVAPSKQYLAELKESDVRTFSSMSNPQVMKNATLHVRRPRTPYSYSVPCDISLREAIMRPLAASWIGISIDPRRAKRITNTGICAPARVACFERSECDADGGFPEEQGLAARSSTTPFFFRSVLLCHQYG